jgi:uncharacterized protein with HEPN domain
LPFNDAQSHLRDILSALDEIQAFIDGMDGEAFQADAKTRAAVARDQRGFRAARSQASRLCPGVPWQNIRGIGNRIRHGYDTVNPTIIWNTVQDHLPPLRTAVRKALIAARSPDQ